MRICRWCGFAAGVDLQLVWICRWCGFAAGADL